jgi:hypothetical protein
MKRFRRFRMPSPAMLIAVIALVVALGGTAYAAKKLGLSALSNGAKNKTVGVGKLTYVSTTKTIPGTAGSEFDVPVSANCPSGLKVIGGGIKVPNPNPGPGNDNIFIQDSYPTTTGWAGHVANYAGASFPATATTTAICANSRAVTGAPPSS